MSFPPDRIEYYNKSLGQQLQLVVTAMRGCQALKAAKTADMPTKASRLWEMNQRYYLVTGRNDAAALALLSACQEAYEGLTDGILTVVEELYEVASQLALFEELCYEVKKEQKLSTLPVCLRELLGFLDDSVKSLQNQMKFMELQLRHLHPQFVGGESALAAFLSELQLPVELEAHLALGLAKIERLLKNPLIVSPEKREDSQNAVAS